MVNVGLVTGPWTPSARQAPRTNVVLPAPSSPATRTTSPGRSVAARAAARPSVSCGPDVSATAAPSAPAMGQAQAQGDARQEQDEPAAPAAAHVEAGAPQL